MGASASAGLFSECTVVSCSNIDVLESIICTGQERLRAGIPSQVKGGRRRRPAGLIGAAPAPTEKLENRLEDLTKQLFELHDLDGDGNMEETDLVTLNEHIAKLHRGQDADTSDVRDTYTELFRKRLDPEGRPVKYDVFRSYSLEVLDGLDPDPEAQEMILEQFVAEAQSAIDAAGTGALEMSMNEPACPGLPADGRSSPGLQAEGRVSPGAGADVPSPRRESKEQKGVPPMVTLSPRVTLRSSLREPDPRIWASPEAPPPWSPESIRVDAAECQLMLPVFLDMGCVRQSDVRDAPVLAASTAETPVLACREDDFGGDDDDIWGNFISAPLSPAPGGAVNSQLSEEAKGLSPTITPTASTRSSSKRITNLFQLAQDAATSGEAGGKSTAPSSAGSPAPKEAAANLMDAEEEAAADLVQAEGAAEEATSGEALVAEGETDAGGETSGGTPRQPSTAASPAGSPAPKGAAASQEDVEEEAVSSDTVLSRKSVPRIRTSTYDSREEPVSPERIPLADGVGLAGSMISTICDSGDSCPASPLSIGTSSL